MKNREAVEAIQQALERFNITGRFVKEDMQEIFNSLGINRTVEIGDNVFNAINAVYLKVIQDILTGDRNV